MKKIFLTAIIFLLSFGKCAAQTPELAAAEIRLICAICSLGAYSDEGSSSLRSMLTANGWQIETLSKKNNVADAKAYLVSKGNVKILTVSGTENLKDLEVDLRAERVPYNDDVPFDPNEKVENQLFVHKGFSDYADVVLGDGLAERLKTLLAENPNAILYLTGHSLGGSAAIVMGLRLSDAGISKDRLKIITFASPAVGSRALAESYEDKLDLTRVVMKGDIVKKSMNALGYVDFGNVIKYEAPGNDHHSEHKMIVYLDSVIRDYYKAGGNLQDEDIKDKIAAPVYVAPVLYDESHLKNSDEEVIFNVLNDSLENYFGQLIFAEPRSIAGNAKDFMEPEVDAFINAGKNAGCKYVLIRILSAKKIRDASSGERHVTLEEMIFDANGFLVSMQTAGTSTENLTLLEAALSAQETLNESAAEVFKK
ncbi:MAG: lipase family protein [Selenomonadaceae bacterium]|nr:lipase family protein [Selenomonadaceae bacterium]